MGILSEKLTPILREKGITIIELGKKVGRSRQQLYNVGKQSIVDSSLLNKIADELEIDRKFFDEFRHPSIHQSQQANGNDGSVVHQGIGSPAQYEEMKEMYERLLAEKDAQINFLKELLKQQ